MATSTWPPSLRDRSDCFEVTVTIDSLVASDHPDLAAKLWLPVARALDEFDSPNLAVTVKAQRNCGFDIDVAPPRAEDECGAGGATLLGQIARAIEDTIADELATLLVGRH